MTIEEQVLGYLKQRGTSIAWLARTGNFSYSSIRNILNGNGKWKRPLTQNHLDKINAALETDFKFPDPEETDD